jgi:hypothetical protein
MHHFPRMALASTQPESGLLRELRGTSFAPLAVKGFSQASQSKRKPPPSVYNAVAFSNLS